MKNAPDKMDWFALFVEGNTLALSHYFAVYNKRLFYIALKQISEPEPAEEIVSDAFHHLWLHREKINSEEHIKAFLYTATRNGCINCLKSLKRRTTAQQNMLHALENQQENELENEEIEAELLARIHQALDQLPEKCKAVFELIYFEDHTTKEVAQKLRITERNVLNQKSRAIKLLRNILS
jgi:RNA polymerase sigma-70 factor (family 1)